jgi:hypothetical protein
MRDEALTNGRANFVSINLGIRSLLFVWSHFLTANGVASPEKVQMSWTAIALLP